MVVPYYKGVSESLKKICGKHGAQVYFKMRTYHQKPPDDPQGSRSNPEKEWGHL